MLGFDITEARTMMRDQMRSTPIYTGSIADVYDALEIQPSPKLLEPLKLHFGLALLFSATERCQQICVHTAGDTMAGLADRMMCDIEMERAIYR